MQSIRVVKYNLPFSQNLWRDQAEHPQLQDREIHIWRAELHGEAEQIAAFAQTLAPDEQQRAARLQDPEKRMEFIIGRAKLRHLLSRYLDMPPTQISFAYQQHGKPVLARAARLSQLTFNVSHSHGIALYAIARGKAIGVDIEFVRSDFANETVIKHFFSPIEAAALRSLPPSQQTEAFFRCWTRKEAIIKALGEGLTHQPNTFSVSLKLGEPATLLNADGTPELSRWSLRELFPGARFVAAVALDGPIGALHCFQY